MGRDLTGLAVGGALVASDGSYVWSMATTPPASPVVLADPSSGGFNYYYAGLAYTDSVITTTYWTDDSTDTDAGGVHIAAGTTNALLAADLKAPGAIAVDSANVYWSDSAGVIWSAGRFFSGVTMMTTGHPAAYMTSDGTTLFWSEPKAGSILTLPVSASDAGSATAIVTGDEPYALAVDATNVYWTSGLGYIEQAPKGGGTVTVLASVTATKSIAADSTYVYFIDSGTWWLDKVPIGGGTLTTFDLSSYGLLNALVAVDSTAVYFGSRTGIYKISPK
jgi:hypothetical protein